MECVLGQRIKTNFKLRHLSAWLFGYMRKNERNLMEGTLRFAIC